MKVVPKYNAELIADIILRDRMSRGDSRLYGTWKEFIDFVGDEREYEVLETKDGNCLIKRRDGRTYWFYSLCFLSTLCSLSTFEDIEK
jgi:hypothetical protein